MLENTNLERIKHHLKLLIRLHQWCRWMKDPKILDIDATDDQALEKAMEHASGYGLEDTTNPWEKLFARTTFDRIMRAIILLDVWGPIFILLKIKQSQDYPDIYNYGQEWFLQQIKVKYGVSISNRQKKATNSIEKLAQFIASKTA